MKKKRIIIVFLVAVFLLQFAGVQAFAVDAMQENQEEQVLSQNASEQDAQNVQEGKDNQDVQAVQDTQTAQGVQNLQDTQGYQSDAIEQNYQTYIDTAPIEIADFVANPLQSIFALLSDFFAENVASIYESYLQLLSFLLLGVMITMLLVKGEWVALLELLIAGGGFLLICTPLLTLAADFAESASDWNIFLLGFIPVFSAVVVTSGETVAASLYSGFFLLCVTAFARALSYFLVPLIECYLALSVTSAFWIGDELPEACKTAGKLLKKLVKFAGSAFTVIFGIQRVFSAAADGVVVQASKAIGSTVPIIGQTVTSAASTYLAGMQVIKTGLGFAAFAIIGASFLPLYLTALAHLCLLSFCGFLCKLFSLKRCGQLFDCLAIGVEAMMAIVALFFFMITVGTALMLVIGAGG